ncbi:hypothetical protein QFC20_006644 [Naganishia adeliensis]|uniref:Uncharacterized protein n=1 Tax=Naganishia adeliensis TaxID=92952 RepID=A0ACC2VA29_9TREE|nr:hypothetical protein QFC20_006644 [Naganishia adeliensis]
MPEQTQAENPAQPSRTQERGARLRELAREIEEDEKNVERLKRELAVIESGKAAAWEGTDAPDLQGKRESWSSYYRLKESQQLHEQDLESFSTKLVGKRTEQALIQAQEDSFWPSRGSFRDNVTLALSSLTAPFV